MTKPVLIFGAGALGKVALEIFLKNDVVVYGFLDDDKARPHLKTGAEAGVEEEVGASVPVLGSTTAEEYLDLIGENCEAFVAIEQRAKQANLVAMLREQKNVIPINAIHPSAIIAESATLGYGNLMNTGVSLGAGATLGNHCILHANATIEHEAVVKDFVQVGAGSVVGAGAKLQEAVFVGAGATIIAGVAIGAGASVGAGAVVLANVKPGEAVLGNPAKVVNPR